MAGEIFISYRRADEAWARLLHTQLRAEGVEAWYDAQIGAGQDWRSATAKALDGSRIFVLLFSAAAAQSEDIAKELAAAIFSKKLVVPVRIEDIQPTGAFLYELASRNWVNAYENTEAKFAELARSLATLVKSGIADESVIPFDRNAGAKAPGPSARARKPVLIALAAVVVVAAAALGGSYWLRSKPPPTQAKPEATRVAVLPFDTLNEGPQARPFAEALTEEIVSRLNSSRIQVVSRGDAALLRGPDRDQKVAQLGVALLFDGTVETDGKVIKIRVHLDDPVNHVTLWSERKDGLFDKSEQLQAGTASSVAAVLACSNRALDPIHGLSDPDLLSRYLHACDVFVNGLDSRQEVYELLASLREVGAKAPGFTPAHSDFAKFALFMSATLPPEQAAPLRKEGEQEAKKALALDRNSPDAYLALSWVLPVTDWAGREKLLRQGVAHDTNWPHTNGFLGRFLAETGRLQDAAPFLQRAAAADLQIDWGAGNALVQCGSGQFEPATSNLMQAIKKKPGDGDIWGNLRKCMIFARRFADVRTLNRDTSLRPTSFTPEALTREGAYLAAGETGKPGDIARARGLALSAPDGPNRLIRNAIQELAAIGLTDDAFALAERYQPGAASTDADSAFLFFPLTLPMRRDPRFMQMAARFGLVDYWRSSGHWPDFCADPGLPYNCRTEANRIKPAK